MKLDDALTPVAEDAPCGPDLDEAQDPAFDDYYFGALGRLPAYYYRPGVERPDGSASPDQIFDSGAVDIATERREIEALLERSRDIRLLVLLAQWETLAGRLDPLADTLEMISALIEVFGPQVHPTTEKSAGARRDALNDLNNQVTMVQPLQFLGLTGTDEVSLRKIKVAAGGSTPLQGERDLTPAMLSDALSDPSNKKRIETNHTALIRVAKALARLSRACQAQEQNAFAPSLDAVTNTVAEMLDAIGAARPELAEVEAIEVVVPEPETADVFPTQQVSEAPIGPAIQNHAEARLTLEACEHYYRRSEPSSAALLLVTQARLLIGRPLIEAIETLLPEKAGQAVVDFGPQTGFALNIERLRQLSGSAPASAPPTEPAEPPEMPAPVIASGAEAAGAIRAVEAFFQRAERSSPVPILLQRARSYLERDFQSLVDELVPVMETNT